MSLDVYLELDEEIVVSPASIPIREEGKTKRITIDEWNERFPDREPIIMNSRITSTVYTDNITHNLNTMAGKAGIYKCLWRPDEIEITKAHQLIKPLMDGLAVLQGDPEYFKQFNPSNGWGSYEGLVEFVVDYLEACKCFPDANVSVWR